MKPGHFDYRSVNAPVYRNNLQEQARNTPHVKAGGGPRQRFPGTRYRRYRCSLPGLAEFTVDRREEADADRGRLSMLGNRDTINLAF